MILSSDPLRRSLVARLGAGPFLGLYSVVALALFVPLVRTYFAHKHAGPLLWSIPLGTPLRTAIYVAMAAAFVLMVAGLVRPSPAGIVPGDPTPHGAQRLTRHPLFMGLGLFGLLHLVPNGNAADVAFFGGFRFSRSPAAGTRTGESWSAGPRGSRASIVRRRFSLHRVETIKGIPSLDVVVVLGGVGVTALLRYFHPAWFGG
jgi:uncharacterized membrane protein